MGIALADYVPSYKIELWPRDNPGAAAEVLVIEGGEVPVGLFEGSRSFTFHLPKDWDFAFDDYAATTGTMKLQRGSCIRATVSMDDFATGTYDLKVFYGRVWKLGPSHRDGEMRIEVTCYDRLAKSRAVGLNISRSTRRLIYEVSWDYNDPAWNASDPSFLVDIPAGVGDGDPVGAGVNEFVPDGMVHLSSKRTILTGDGDDEMHEFTNDEYKYSPSRKQIYFTVDQSTAKGAGEQRIWTARLYYYDPTDLSNSVKAFLSACLSGTAWSRAGGLGIPGGSLSLAEIFGFDGVTPRLLREIAREKTQGPFLQVLDDLRQAGLLPKNYWLFDNPVDSKITGVHVLQDNLSAIVPGYGVLETSESVDSEGVAGRVEIYSEDTSPINYALGATASSDLTGLAGYAERGTVDNTKDSDIDTQWEVWKDSGVTMDYPVQRTADGFAVYDLGRVRDDIRRIQVIGCRPLEGETEIPLYHINRRARYTISASENAISSANPGIPVSPAAINVEVDPQNIGRNNGVDIDVECTSILRMRYVAIRGEQDLLFRRSDKVSLSGTVVRESWFGWRDVKILGDSRFRYPDTHARANEVPFAEITPYATTVSAVTSSTVFNVADASFIAIGAYIQVMRAGTPITTKVTNKVGSTLTVATAVTGVTIGDKVGLFGRWMLNLAGSWEDLYYPKLHGKIAAVTDWLDILEDQTPADISEAEGLCVERLIELIKVREDYRVTIALDIDVVLGGDPISPYAGDEPFLPTDMTYRFNSPSDSLPMVTQEISGTNYEEEPQ